MTKPHTDRRSSINAAEFIWDTTAETEVHGFVWPEIEKLMLRRNPSDILDIGCGNGVLTSKLRSIARRCVGIDISRSGIKIAKERFPGIQFECASIDEPLPSEMHGSFDVVVGVEVIEHLFLPRGFFERAKEALRPNGYILVSTPYHGYLKNMALALADQYDAHWHPLRDHGHIKFFSETTLRQLFEEQEVSIDYFERVGRLPLLARSMLMGGALRGRQVTERESAF